jgi:hemoglobin-like flavoprotein
MTHEPVEPAETAPGCPARAALLRDSKKLMAERGAYIAWLFYVQLLRRHPRMAAVFACADIRQQAATLAAMLEFIIEYADHPRKLGGRAIGLGLSHASRGLVRQDYADFNETLAEVLADWQSALPVEEARRIWLADLNALAEVMLIAGSQ